MKELISYRLQTSKLDIFIHVLKLEHEVLILLQLQFMTAAYDVSYDSAGITNNPTIKPNGTLPLLT